MIAQVGRGFQNGRTRERNVAAAQQPRYMDAKHHAPYLPLRAAAPERPPHRSALRSTAGDPAIWDTVCQRAVPRASGAPTERHL